MKRAAIAIIVVIIAVLAVLLAGVLKEGNGGKPIGNGVSLEEKALIEKWIGENNLNQYGDSKDTVYLGGTPLFDERTGTQIDRYEYIKRNHPDKPWMNIQRSAK